MTNPQTETPLCGAYGGQCDQPATHTAIREGWPPMPVCDVHATHAIRLGWLVEARKP